MVENIEIISHYDRYTPLTTLDITIITTVWPLKRAVDSFLTPVQLITIQLSMNGAFSTRRFCEGRRREIANIKDIRAAVPTLSNEVIGT